MGLPRARRLLPGLTVASSLVWMSLIPAAAAAQAAPTVTPGSVRLVGASTIGTLGGTATFSATAQDPGGQALYQFWVEEPNGVWVDAQNYSPSPQFTLATPSAGDYLVQVYALDRAQVAAGDWAAAQGALPDGVFVGSRVTVAASTTDVAPGTRVTLKASATDIYDPQYQFWVESPAGQWTQSGPYGSAPTYTFTAATSGAYRFVAYAKSPDAVNDGEGALMSAISSSTAYGIASQVVLTPGTPSVAADNTAADPLAITVEDRAGIPVADFTGTVDITSTPAGAFGLSGRNPVHITNGSAVVDLSTSSVGTYTLSADHLASAAAPSGGAAGQPVAANVQYPTVTVAAVAPSGAGLSVASELPSLSTNAQNGTPVWITLTDQAGQPFSTPVGQYVTVSLTGPGTLVPGAAAVTSERLYLAPGSSTLTARVYDRQGTPGTITVTAAASGLAGGQTTVVTYETGAPAALAIHSAITTAHNGESETLYTVDVVDAEGHLVTTGVGATTDIELANSLGSSSGALSYYWGSSLGYLGQVTGGAEASSFTVASVTSASPLVTVGGQVQFAVETDQGQATPASITVMDASGLAQSALYQFAAPTAAYAALIPAYLVTGPSVYVYTAGQTGRVQAQLTDQYGTPVHESGQPIWFTLKSDGNYTSGFVKLVSGASSIGDVYEAFTNSQGVASMSYSFPSGDSPTLGTPNQYRGFWFRASGTSGAYDAPNGYFYGIEDTDNYLVPRASYAAALALNTGGASVSVPGGGVAPYSPASRLPAGSVVTGLRVVALNSLGGLVAGHDGGNYWRANDFIAGDSLLVTSSNPAVASLNTTNRGIAYSSDQWLLNDSGRVYSSGAFQIPPLDLGRAGTATLTFQDVSNNTMPSVSITVTVVPGTATQAPLIEYQGQPISSTNAVSLTANTPVELSVVNVDAAGDPVPATSALTVTLPAAPAGTEWKTAGAVGVSSTVGTVTIPVGSTSAALWVVSGSSEKLTSVGSTSD